MNNIDIEALVRPNIKALAPYSTARDEYKGDLGVFLDANESPYDNGWNRYPDPHQKQLKERISQIKGVPAESIFLGNGSDEAIDLVFRVFCNPGIDNVVAIEPSYGMYRVAADINDIQVRSVKLGAMFSLPVQALLDACDANTKAIFLCSPNNPTGNAFAKEDIVRLLDEFNGIVVVDEAYIDFCSTPGVLPLIADYPNLLVLQTFSKAWGLAALRLGLAFAQPRTIEIMSMVKYPYNINAATQKLAMEALWLPIDDKVKQIVEQRGILSARLANLRCVKQVFPSEANFILVRMDDADAAYDFLIQEGIIVRNRNRVTLCEGCLRMTIGTPDENQKLIETLTRYEESNLCR